MSTYGDSKKHDQSKVSIRLRNSNFNDIHVGYEYSSGAPEEIGARRQAKHEEVGPDSLLHSDALYQVGWSGDNPEPEIMKEFGEWIAQHPWSPSPPSTDAAQFLHMFVRRIGAKNTIEIGVYTGYSLLATALALPDDGKVRSTFEIFSSLDLNNEIMKVVFNSE